MTDQEEFQFVRSLVLGLRAELEKMRAENEAWLILVNKLREKNEKLQAANEKLLFSSEEIFQFYK